jgi:hypothetical protein
MTDNFEGDHEWQSLQKQRNSVRKATFELDTLRDESVYKRGTHEDVPSTSDVETDRSSRHIVSIRGYTLTLLSWRSLIRVVHVQAPSAVLDGLLIHRIYNLFLRGHRFLLSDLRDILFQHPPHNLVDS